MSARAKPRRRKTPLLAALAAIAAALALLYAECGARLGLGGGGGIGTPRPADEAPRTDDGGVAARCKLRLDAAGLTRDGKPVAPHEAAEACRAGGAELVVTGDAREGDLAAIRAAFEAGGVVLLVR